MNDYIKVIKNYAVFSGRASRKEFWMFALINAIIMFVLMFVDGLIGSIINIGDNPIGIISTIYRLCILIPSLAVSVRRLHDVNKSGWWFLIVFIPIIGLYFLLLVARDSKPGANQYGPNPKEAKTA